MGTIITFYLFIIGCCIGSFLNVVIDRLPRGKSPFGGRSHCDYCGHTLSVWDLIPVVSFALLLGKCRYCQKRLSFQYPLIEVATGLLFIATYIFSGSPVQGRAFLEMLVLAILFSSFFALSIMDIKYGILADMVVFVALCLSAVFLLFTPQMFVGHIIAGLACFGVFLSLFFLTRERGIGLGDVKLSFVMGLFLGFPSVLIAYYVAFLTGGFIAIILVLAKKKKLVGGTIAFGPFLLAGTYISWYFGNTLWTFFLHLLGIL